MENDDLSNLMLQGKSAVIEILGSATADLSKSIQLLSSQSESPKGFFPNGINYIQITLGFDPEKISFTAELIISSEPQKPTS